MKICRYENPKGKPKSSAEMSYEDQIELIRDICQMELNEHWIGINWIRFHMLSIEVITKLYQAFKDADRSDVLRFCTHQGTFPHIASEILLKIDNDD